MQVDTLIALARFRHQELIDAAARDRLARQAAKTHPVLRIPTADTRRPIRPRILAWLRG